VKERVGKKATVSYVAKRRYMTESGGWNYVLQSQRRQREGGVI
jgi:hypothetical protein